MTAMSRGAPSPAQDQAPEVAADVLRPGLRVVFCGTALGTASAKAGAYYAGPGNKFWTTLYKTGLTPELLPPWEYRRVLDHEIGLTDLCKTRSGSDREIGDDGFDVARLAAQMEAFSPELLAFNGKKAAGVALGLERVEYGPQSAEVGGTGTYVLPSTSGAASGSWDIGPWRQLAELVLPR